jgi:hypothetical protein
MVALLTLYKGFVRAAIDYGSMFYNAHRPGRRANKLTQLEKLQNRAMRIITGAFCSTPIVALQAVTGLMPLRLRRLSLITDLAHKLEAKGNRVYHKWKNKQLRYIPHFSRAAPFLKEANTLASQAQPPLERSKKQITLVFYNRWQTQWTTANKGRRTYQFFPEIKAIPRLPTLLSRQEETSILRLWFGHSQLNEHRARKGITSGADCPSCPGQPETTEHLLLHCPAYNHARVRLIRHVLPITHSLSPTTNILLTHPLLLRSTAFFLSLTGRRI